MRKFDFDDPIFAKSCQERQKFYRENYDKPITIEQFVAEVVSWPKRKLHNSYTRSPSAARGKYKSLVEVYGFFPGGQDATKN